jgi:hypothetical protein
MALDSTTTRRRSHCLSRERRLVRGAASSVGCEWTVVLEPNGFTADLASRFHNRTTIRAEVLSQRPDTGSSPARIVARLGGGWLTLDCRTPVPVAPATAAAITHLLEALNCNGAELSD